MALVGQCPNRIKSKKINTILLQITWSITRLRCTVYVHVRTILISCRKAFTIILTWFSYGRVYAGGRGYKWVHYSVFRQKPHKRLLLIARRRV